MHQSNKIAAVKLLMHLKRVQSSLMTQSDHGSMISDRLFDEFELGGGGYIKIVRSPRAGVGKWSANCSPGHAAIRKIQNTSPFPLTIRILCNACGQWYYVGIDREILTQ